MLVELSINNFAIIKDLNVRFTKGLNIVTGETGAGKSILIEALGIILGSRSNKDYIRSGEEEAYLEAVFYVEDPIFKGKIKDLNIDIDEDNILIISREISRDMPSLSKVNGKTVNLSLLNYITKELVDIFGQHEHQSLLDTSNHIKIIDDFGKDDFKKNLDEYRAAYSDLKALRKRLEEISIDTSSKDREIDILRYQIREIEEADINIGRDSTIYEDFNRLDSQEEIINTLSKIINDIDYSDDMPAVGDRLSKALMDLNKIKEKDSSLASIYDRFTNVYYELLDINREFKLYIESFTFDEEAYYNLEKRLDLINNLKSKYGNSLEEIISFKASLEERLDSLLNQDKKIKLLEEEIISLEKELEDLAQKISNQRKKIALDLEGKIQKELSELNMNNVLFKVEFKLLKDFSETGLDNVEFMISTNLGEDLKPLSRIASGGEMSRIMLAFKSILAYMDHIPTLIFDEIDTGISGRTAQIVGEKIYDISTRHQVICISHLPQITALADSHYLIKKEVVANKTGSYIEKLNMEARVEELARLIGGIDITDTTRKQALEMIYKSSKKNL